MAFITWAIYTLPDPDFIPDNFSMFTLETGSSAFDAF